MTAMISSCLKEKFQSLHKMRVLVIRIGFWAHDTIIIIRNSKVVYGIIAVPILHCSKSAEATESS